MSVMKYIWAIAILFLSCKTKTTSLNSKEAESVKDSVLLMTARIAGDLSAKGPIAWLDYFEDSPDFFMAAEGSLTFKDYQTARIYIRDTLVNIFHQIILHWDHIRIDPLTSGLASIGAGFREELTDSAGKTISEAGYFSAIAEQTTQGWQLRNAHWSILKPQ
jgi:hypothetical protein